MKSLLTNIKTWLTIAVLGATVYASGIGDIQVQQLGADTDVTFDTLILNSNRAEKWALKADKLSEVKPSKKRLISNGKNSFYFEITEVNTIEEGLEIFARVWDSNDIQIGFGVDGTVDIERFVLINPPVLVEDPKGKIVRTYILPSGEEIQHSYKVAPLQAIGDVLVQAVSVKQQKFIGSTDIVPNKIGKTTYTFNPLGGTGGDTTDASWFEDVSTSWATIITKTSSRTIYQSSCYVDNSLGNGNGSSFFTVARYGATINTSSIPDEDTITSATLSLYGNSKLVVGSEERAYLYELVAPSSDGTLTTADFNNGGTTQFGVTPSSWSTTDWNNISLNSSGITAINKTGKTRYMLNGWYDVNATAPNNSNEFMISCYDADQSGTAQDPLLTVETGIPVTIVYPRMKLEGDISLEGDMVIQ
jgi:hypothetical protein